MPFIKVDNSLHTHVKDITKQFMEEMEKEVLRNMVEALEQAQKEEDDGAVQKSTV